MLQLSFAKVKMALQDAKNPARGIWNSVKNAVIDSPSASFGGGRDVADVGIRKGGGLVTEATRIYDAVIVCACVVRVCVCVCVQYIDICVYEYIYICINTYVCNCTCKHVCVCVYVLCMHVCVYFCNTCTSSVFHTRARVHTHTHAHTHTFTHTQTKKCINVCMYTAYV